MAGIKITDLTPLITPVASDDLLYIVDVSDTTESPQGTSKSIAVGDIAIIESGLWTPTITTTYSGSTLFKAFYTRVNNSVSFYISFGLTNASSSLFGDTFFTSPDGLQATINLLGTMSFTSDASFANDNITSFSIGNNVGEIGFSMINVASQSTYSIIIQGTYLIA